MTAQQPPAQQERAGLLSDADLAELRAWYIEPATSPGPCPVCGAPREVKRHDRNNGIVWVCGSQMDDPKAYSPEHYRASWVEILKPSAGVTELLAHIAATRRRWTVDAERLAEIREWVSDGTAPSCVEELLNEVTRLAAELAERTRERDQLAAIVGVECPIADLTIVDSLRVASAHAGQCAEEMQRERDQLAVTHARCTNLSNAEAQRIFEEARQMREERDRLQEWRDSVSTAVKNIPEFHSGEWGGDKEGWGFHFEVVNWLIRERDQARGDLAASRDATAELYDDLASMIGEVDRETERSLLATLLKYRPLAPRPSGPDQGAIDV